MLTNLCRTVYVDLKAKVKIHGVTIAKDLGLPIFFIKQEDTEKLNQSRAIGTIKEGVIERDTECIGLLCC